MLCVAPMKLKLFEKKPEEIMFAQAQAQTNMCVYQTCLKINTLFTTDINLIAVTMVW